MIDERNNNEFKISVRVSRNIFYFPFPEQGF